MKIVIAGSRDIPAHAGTSVIHVLVGLLPEEEEIEVFLRRGVHTRPGPLEAEVAYICNELQRAGLPVFTTWRMPTHQGGRASVFSRDVEMIAESDLVLVFLSSEGAEDGYTGTYHVMEQAIQQGRPCYAWVALDRDGVTLLQRFGEWDPEGTFATLLKDA